MPAQVVRAKTAFTCELGDDQVIVRTGERYAADHPAVKGREALFESEDADVERAAPVRRRRRATATKRK
jgi:hypothetical protein